MENDETTPVVETENSRIETSVIGGSEASESTVSGAADVEPGVETAGSEVSPPAEPVTNDPKDSPEPPDAASGLRGQIVAAIETCYDPEIPVNIYELGLIYDIDINEDSGHVDINMTLTSPACPAAGSLPPEVEQKVGGVDGVSSVKVEVVWEPTWTPEKMSEAAKLQLGFF